jgi:hypothetical protein
MTAQRFSRLAAVIFALVALVHLFRAISGFEVVIGGEVVPVWPSWLIAIIIGFLAYLGFTAGGRQAV